MYPGRSAWTRGVLALGVGALFLLGWRIDTAGDALSASTPIDSDRNYFSVAVASSRSSSRHDDHGKKEERPSDGQGIERQDRQASRRDYSAGGQETRTPSDVHWNAKPDGEHGASYSEEISLPSRPLSWNAGSGNYFEGSSLPTDAGDEDRSVTGFLESKDFNDDNHDTSKNRFVHAPLSSVRNSENEIGGSFSTDKSLPTVRDWRNNEEDSEEESVNHLFASRSEKEDKSKVDNRVSTYHSMENPLPSWGPVGNDAAETEINRASTSDLRKSSFMSRDLGKKDDEANGGSKGYSIESRSFSLLNTERNNDESKSYATGRSLPSWDPGEKDRTPDEPDGGSTDYSSGNSVPLLTGRRNDYPDNENNIASLRYSTGEFLLPISRGENVEGNHGLKNPKALVENGNDRGRSSGTSGSSFSSRTIREADNTASSRGDRKSVDYWGEKSPPSLNREKSDRSRDYRRTGSLKENSRRPSGRGKIDLAGNNRESRPSSITKKNESYRRENPRRRRSPEKIELIENNHGSMKGPITKRSDLASFDDPNRRADDDEANYTVFRSEQAAGAGEQDESRFSKDDEETRDALNGRAAGERSDVKENLSRRVNGQSMNEVGKSLGRSRYSDAAGSLSLTLRHGLGENDDETQRLAKMESVYPDRGKSNRETSKSAIRRRLLAYNLSSASTSVPRSRASSDINNGDPRHRNHRSISINAGIERKPNVGFLDEILGDFHNSDRPANQEGYKRGEESIHGSVDPPAATRVLAGMQRDPVLFSPRDHDSARSSAKTSQPFRSRKGRAAERDRGNILGRGATEARSPRRSPQASDPYVDFRGIHKTLVQRTFDGYQLTDRENTLDPREDSYYLDQEITKVTDKPDPTFEESDGDRGFEGEMFHVNVRRLKDKERVVSDEKVSGRLNAGKFGSKMGLRSEEPRDVSSSFGGSKTVSFGSLDAMLGSKEIEERESSKIGEFEVKAEDKSLSSLFFGNADYNREKRLRVRRKRYTNYYSPQSVTPMAYVHIQPAYPVPAAPAPNRKCVQCMVVYKPCASPPRPPIRPALPTHKYQELASKWHGLKYVLEGKDLWCLSIAGVQFVMSSLKETMVFERNTERYRISFFTCSEDYATTLSHIRQTNHPSSRTKPQENPRDRTAEVSVVPPQLSEP
ncbi:uncharacterized protein LOC143220891 [Lasioglossum baleicum]|uniref:uncharacterized protein LOC143220891 n=1 Tax=Lasioglossum baleicum TaxID=434251 RepID=UPI003FCE9A04